MIIKGHGAVRLGAEPAPIPEGPGDPYRSRGASENRGDQIVTLRVLEDHLPDPAARPGGRRKERLWGLALGAALAVAVLIALLAGC